MIILLLLVSWVSCEDSKVAVQDLLSSALSPAALLGVQGLRPPGPDTNQTVASGDLSHALGTMLYHRSMMNEYLCHNYVADEILSELRPLERSGEAAEPAEGGALGGGVPRDHLLADPGSSGYKDWLEKSSGLEDMYAHGGKGSDQEGFETGDVTGYATMQGGKESFGYGGAGGGGGGAGWTSGGGAGWSGGGGGGSGGVWSGEGGGWSAGGGPGWNSGGSEWSGSEGQGWHDNSGSGVSEWGWEEQETGKGLALKDLFDLALTALAFLAFGVFALQLIMACFAKTPQMTVMMTVTTTQSTAETRSKRETSQLNELAYRVLTSIDRWMELEKQPKDSCLQYTLCDNNKYSRALNNRNKLWLPVWSLGMSWAAGLGQAVSRIDHIRASVLGLGNADCAAIYPQCGGRTRNFK